MADNGNDSPGQVFMAAPSPSELILTLVVLRQVVNGTAMYQALVRSNGSSTQEEEAILQMAGKVCEQALAQRKSRIMVVPGAALPKNPLA